MSDDPTCPTCAEKTGTKRYCAPGRCYCAHPACPAYPTWVDLTATPADLEETP